MFGFSMHGKSQTNKKILAFCNALYLLPTLFLASMLKSLSTLTKHRKLASAAAVVVIGVRRCQSSVIRKERREQEENRSS
jgi:hypothetical protein